MGVGLAIGRGEADCMNERITAVGEDAKGVANLENVVVVEVIRRQTARVFEPDGGNGAIRPQRVAGDADEGNLGDF